MKFWWIISLILSAALWGQSVADVQLQATLDLREQRLADEMQRSWQAEKAFLDSEIARLEEELATRKARLEQLTNANAQLNQAVSEVQAKLKAVATDGINALREQLASYTQTQQAAAIATIEYRIMPDDQGQLRQFTVLRVGNTVAYALEPISRKCAMSRLPNLQWQWIPQHADAVVKAIQSVTSRGTQLVELPL